MSSALPEATKYTCRFFIGIENDDQFCVAKRIIGAGGAKMKEIVSKAGGDAKLRLRGFGSGFVERETNTESNEPLQLCISCPRSDSYEIAIRLTEELLRDVYSQYDRYCIENGLPHRAPEIRMSERHHTGDGGGGGGFSEGDTPARVRRGGRVRKRGGPGGGGGGTNSRQPSPHHFALRDHPEHKGTPPAGAPPVEEIERLIEDRNGARRKSDFREADRIRDYLRERGVVLSDEKGSHGSGLSVTSWRYWKE